MAANTPKISLHGHVHIFKFLIRYTTVVSFFQDRSVAIATYALCGFANVGSIGTVMGALGSMAPHRKQDISGMALRAMITGTMVSFMNACTAGKYATA